MTCCRHLFQLWDNRKLSFEKVARDETKATERVASRSNSTQSKPQEFCDIQVQVKYAVKMNENVKIFALLKPNICYFHSQVTFCISS